MLTLQEIEYQLGQAEQTCNVIEDALSTLEACKAENFPLVMALKNKFQETVHYIDLVEKIREEFEDKVVALEKMYRL